jgi:hypothetical protein
MLKCLVAAAVVLTGCGKSKSACKTEAHELATYLRAMDHTPASIKVPDDVHLAARPELPSMNEAENAPVVFVRAAGIEFRGEHPSVVELEAKLAEVATKTQDDITAGKVPKRFVWDHRIYVAIDRDAPWSSVAAVAGAAAKAGYVKWIAMFAKPSPVAAPPRSAISDKLDKLLADDSVDNKATEIARMTSDVIKTCPALGKAFGAVSSDEGDKAAELIEAIEPALVDCNCDLDVPSLRSVFFSIAGNLHPIGTIAVQLDDSATPLAFPSATPWHDVAPKLAAGTAWFVAS